MRKNNNDNEQFGVYIAISIALHLIVFMLFSYGLPYFFKAPLEPQIVTFEILPVDAISNVKTQKVQQEKEIEEISAKKIQKTKQEEAPKPKKKNEPKAQENKKESKRDFDEKKPNKEVVSIKPKEDKKKEEKKKSDKAQEKQVKDEEKPQKKKIPTDKEMDALLKTLEKASEGKEEKSMKRAVAPKSDAKEESMGQYNEENPLSISEEQAIRQQIERQWNVPIGVQDAGEMVITLYISLKIDGTVEQVKIVDTQCPTSAAATCKAAVDSAVRAVWQASPLENLSPMRYDTWKAFHISFDPRDVLGM